MKTLASNGTVFINGDHYFVGMALGGQRIGLEQLDEFRWKVWLRDIDCGELELLPRWIDDYLRPRAADAEREESWRRASSRGHPRIKKADESNCKDAVNEV